MQRAWLTTSHATDETDHKCQQFLDFAADWGIPSLDTPAKKAFAKTVDAAAKKISKHDVTGTADLLDAYGVLHAASGNALFVEAEGRLHTRIKFLRPKEADAYDWTTIDARAANLKKQLG